MEAIAIVLAVSFLALGWRPGIVVAIAIPLVLAITFVVMEILGISLQRISLGALIIALGLLVDDAMIAVEMMITKMEEGYDKITAATYAYTSTAFPMLTGTLVTIAGFVPVGFAKSGAGEYCFTLFAVVGIALVVSWVVAVLFTPLTGVFILPDTTRRATADTARRASRAGSTTCSTWRCGSKWLVLAGTAGLFVLSLVGMGFVQQQFFPKSDRPELLVDLTLAAERLDQGDAGDGRPRREAAQGRSRHRPLELLCRPGRGALLPAARRAARQRLLRPGRGRHQGLCTQRARVQARLEKALADRLRRRAWRASRPLELGPPVGWPLKFRVSGPDPEQTRELAQAFAQVLGAQRQHAQHQLRLERAGQGHQGRGRPGPGARARHQLAAARRQHQRGAVGHHDHAAARRAPT